MTDDNIEDGRNIKTAEREWDNGGIEFTKHANTYKLVRALLSEADRIDNDLDAIKHSRHINTAVGEDLGKFGKLVELERKDGEGDDKYRARIKVQFRVQTISGTFDEFAEFSAVLFDTDIENILFTRNLSADSATANVAADPEVYNNTALTRSEVSEYLGRAVPAGHEIKALERGTFRLKSDGDTNDPSKGLTSDSTSDGGTLAADVL